MSFSKLTRHSRTGHTDKRTIVFKFKRQKGAGFNAQSSLEEINYICLTCKKLRQLKLGVLKS